MSLLIVDADGDLANAYYISFIVVTFVSIVLGFVLLCTRRAWVAYLQCLFEIAYFGLLMYLIIVLVLYGGLIKSKSDPYLYT